METLVAIILVIIMIIYDSNLVETFKKKIENFNNPTNNDLNLNLSLPNKNPLIINTNKVWIFSRTEYSSRKWTNRVNEKQPIPNIEELCIASIFKHMPSYNIQIVNVNNIQKLLPEYTNILSLCNSFYMYYNLIKYAILNKYGGLWIPSNYILTKPLSCIEKCKHNKLLTFSRNNNQLVDNYGLSDDIICCTPDNLIIKEMLCFLKKQLNSFQNDLIFKKTINKHFNTLLDQYKHHHTDQQQLMIGNKHISVDDLFSNEIDVELINYAIIDSHLEEIRHNHKYSFLLHLDKKNIIESNMLIGKILNNALLA
tara:strand:+ start:3921 stop:4853 length:933 start_codon:yes stop_codon:yes gene_type:complete